MSGVKDANLLETSASDGEGIGLLKSILIVFSGKVLRFERTETGYPSVRIQAREINHKKMGKDDEVYPSLNPKTKKKIT